ncbi:hypothetical protein GQR36_19700 [Enterococcus termitis]
MDNNNSFGLRPDSISFVLKRTTVTSSAWQKSQIIQLAAPEQASNQWQMVLDSIIPEGETTPVSLAAFNNQEKTLFIQQKKPRSIQTIHQQLK